MTWRHLESHAFAAIFTNCQDGILFTDPRRAILAANPAACALLGLTERQICALGRDGLRDVSDGRWCTAVTSLYADGQVRADLRLRRADGSAFEADITVSTFTTESGEPRACVIFRDVSRRVAEHERLEREATLDVLTDLSNRRGFAVLAGHTLAEAAREGAAMDLLFLDIDGFKGINDEHGHATGDRVLRQVADILRHACRASDVLARLGGDEFVVLMRHESPSRTVATADRISGGLRSGGDLAIPLQVSVGIVHGQPGSTLDELVAEADQRMYAHKRRRIPLPRLDPRQARPRD